MDSMEKGKVWRCKERRRMMKHALSARYHLAAAHIDYCNSLRTTGSVLVSFASGSPLPVSHNTPAVVLFIPNTSNHFIPNTSNQIRNNNSGEASSSTPDSNSSDQFHDAFSSTGSSDDNDLQYVEPFNPPLSDNTPTPNSCLKKVVVWHRDFVEISEALRELFDKAADTGERVSQMLEVGKLPCDGSFNHSTEAMNHSDGILSNLGLWWTEKPSSTVRSYEFDPNSFEQSGSSRSLCSTLEQLLALEKKAHHEVKASEGVKTKLAKKMSFLQTWIYRGKQDMKLDSTKTTEPVSATSCDIIRIADSDLVPHLLNLCREFRYMWGSMNQYHDIQNKLVQQVRGLVNRSTKGESVFNLHIQATKDLESAISAWHTSFCHMIKFLRHFISSLHVWFELTTLDGELTHGTEFLTLMKDWKLSADRVPDIVASEGIKSFINAIHSIYLEQIEELTMRQHVEEAYKELEKKASSIRKSEEAYYQSHSKPDHIGWFAGEADPLYKKKLECATSQRRVEDEMKKHEKAVEVTRAVTLSSIQTGLPGVFQAMASVSATMNESLAAVCAIE